MSTLLDRLLDDAAVFPPGNARLDVAVREHARHRTSALASLVGPLLVRDVDVPQLPELAGGPLEIGVIAATGPLALEQAMTTLHDFPHVRVVAFELPLGAELATGELISALTVPDGITVSVELPRPGPRFTEAWLAAADEVSAAGLQVKLRTGGVDASAHPGEQELAAMLSAVVPRRLKLTAGLHRAVRNTQPATGFEQHGFLNIMIAVHRLLAGATADEAAEVLASRDAAALADTVRSWSDDDAAAVRRTFRSFGCCGVTEPYDDLLELGLIA